MIQTNIGSNVVVPGSITITTDNVTGPAPYHVLPCPQPLDWSPDMYAAMMRVLGWPMWREQGDGIARLPAKPAPPDYSAWASDWDLLPDA